MAQCVGSTHSMPCHTISYFRICETSVKKVVTPLLSRWWCDQRKIKNQMKFSEFDQFYLCAMIASSKQHKKTIIKTICMHIIWFFLVVLFIYFFFFIFRWFGFSHLFLLVYIRFFYSYSCSLFLFRKKSNESNRCDQQARDYIGLSCSNSNVVVTIK